MRPALVSALALSLLLLPAAARANDLDRDGVEDTVQRARLCGVDSELPVCDALVDALITDDLASFLHVVGAPTGVRVTSARGAPRLFTAAGFEQAVRAGGGVRRFFDASGGSGTRVAIPNSCGRCAPPRIDFRIVIGTKRARLRFEADALGRFQLTAVDLR